MCAAKTYSVRLEESVAKEYIDMATSRGIGVSSLFRELLTDNLHLATFKFEIYKLEQTLDDHKKYMQRMSQEIQKNEITDQNVARALCLLMDVLIEKNYSVQFLNRSFERADELLKNNNKGK